MKNIDWVSIVDKPMPFDEQGLLVSHPHGVEYIVWVNRQWSYCYSDGRGIGELIKSISHWCKPTKAAE